MSQLDEFDKEAEKEATANGGFVCQARFEAGYKVFVAGLGNRESFFSYTPGNDKEQAVALAKAKAKLTEFNITDKHPSMSAQLTCFKSTVKGKIVTWKDDRCFTYPTWTDAYKKAFRPSLSATNITAVGDYWMRVAFVPDPSGKMKKDDPTKVEWIAIVAETFPNEAAATAKALTMTPADSSEAPRANPALDMYKQLVPEMTALKNLYTAKGKTEQEAVAAVAVEYQLTPEQLQQLGVAAAQAPVAVAPVSTPAKEEEIPF